MSILCSTVILFVYLAFTSRCKHFEPPKTDEEARKWWDAASTGRPIDWSLSYYRFAIPTPLSYDTLLHRHLHSHHRSTYVSLITFTSCFSDFWHELFGIPSERLVGLWPQVLCYLERYGIDLWTLGLSNFEWCLIDAFTSALLAILPESLRDGVNFMRFPEYLSDVSNSHA